MSYALKRRAIPPARDPANRGTLEALATAVNELSGTVGQNVDRAVRVGELVEAGILQLNPAGMLERKTIADGPVEIADVNGLQTALDGKQPLATAWNTGNFDPATKANANAVVNLTTAQTVGGVKSFTAGTQFNATDGQIQFRGGANTDASNRDVSVVHNKSSGNLGIYDNRVSAWLLRIDNGNKGYLAGGEIWTAGNFNPASKYDSTTKAAVHAPNGPSGDMNALTGFSTVSAHSTSANSPFGNAWYNLINIRHRGGSGDGVSYGGQIAFGMTAYTDRIAFRAQNNSAWGAWQNLVSGDMSVLKIVKMTQATYDALGTKDANTMYVIVG